jgi:hypothetical protein
LSAQWPKRSDGTLDNIGVEYALKALTGKAAQLHWNATDPASMLGSTLDYDKFAYLALDTTKSNQKAPIFVITTKHSGTSVLKSNYAYAIYGSSAFQ